MINSIKVTPRGVKSITKSSSARMYGGWRVVLICGHEIIKDQIRKPTFKTAHCHDCSPQGRHESRLKKFLRVHK